MCRTGRLFARDTCRAVMCDVCRRVPAPIGAGWDVIGCVKGFIVHRPLLRVTVAGFSWPLAARPCPQYPLPRRQPCRRSRRRSGGRRSTNRRRWGSTTSRWSPLFGAARRRPRGNGRCSTRAWGWWPGRALHTSRRRSGAQRLVSVPLVASSWCDCDREENSRRTGCRPRAAPRSRGRHRCDCTPT